MCRLRVSWGRANQNAKFQRSPQSEELLQGVKQEGEEQQEGVAVEQMLDAPANADMTQQKNASYMDERELHMAPKYLPAGIAMEEGHWGLWIMLFVLEEIEPSTAPACTASYRCG